MLCLVQVHVTFKNKGAMASVLEEDSSYKCHARAGLCNKLRYLYSIIPKVRRKQSDRRFRVAWSVRANECPGRYDEVLEPLEGVEFEYCTPSRVPAALAGIHSFYTVGPVDFSLFRPKRELVEAAEHFVMSHLGRPFAAVHIRRTDFFHAHKKNKSFAPYFSLEHFFEFVDSFLSRYPDSKVFVATDNSETQRELKDKYGEAVVFYDAIRGIEGHRETSLTHAVMDILIASMAEEFQGTPKSSFSEFIQYYSAWKRGETHPDLKDVGSRSRQWPSER